jgi:outer membrane protein TolC
MSRANDFARATAVLVLALGGCVAPERAADDARAAVRGDVDARLRTLPHDDPGAVADARIRALLADGIDEDEAVRIALLSNREIVAGYAELGVGAADLEQASLWANPILDVGFLFFGDGTEIDLGLTQSFVDVLQRPARQAAAEYELEARRARVARTVVAHAFATRRAHVDALAARARFELETRHAAAAEASVELVRTLADAGNVIPSDVAREEAALAMRLLDRSNAEMALLAAREALTREMGLFGDEIEWTLAGSLAHDPAAAVDLDHVESRAIAASLDLAELRARANTIAQEGELARQHAITPDARLGVGAQQDADDSDWGFGPRGSIGIPLTDSGRAREFAARSRLEVARARHWARAVEIRSLARTFRDRLRALDANARFSREVHVPAQQRVVRETLRNYNAMQIGAMDVLRAQGIEIAAERRGVALLADAWNARLDLEELLAGSANDARIAADMHVESDPTDFDFTGAH